MTQGGRSPRHADAARLPGPYFVKAAEREAIAIIVWDTAEHANAGGAILGPTLFNQYIAPYAESQDRVVAEVVASAEA